MQEIHQPEPVMNLVDSIIYGRWYSMCICDKKKLSCCGQTFAELCDNITQELMVPLPLMWPKWDQKYCITSFEQTFYM